MRDFFLFFLALQYLFVRTDYERINNISYTSDLTTRARYWNINRDTKRLLIKFIEFTAELNPGSKEGMNKARKDTSSN